MQHVLRYAVLLGGVGFAVGFVGPMILDPTSGNGPLLGIFVTGPAGVVVGTIVGVVQSARRSRA
jgi:hypothetical protein